MESSNARKMKKAVVTLQKLDLSTQGAQAVKETCTDSGGSEDTVGENPALDSTESNVGCADEDDLENKIQAFSIPVKKDDKSSSVSEPDEKIVVNNKGSVTSDKSKSTETKLQSIDTKISKIKNIGKAPHDKSDLEKEKLSHTKTTSEKEKLAPSKAMREKEKIPLGSSKPSSSLEHVEASKSEDELKSGKVKQEVEVVTMHNKRKRKCNMESKSAQETDSSSIQKVTKQQKQDKQSGINTPSTSKANNTFQTPKSNISKKNRNERVSLDHTHHGKRAQNLVNSESKKSNIRESSEDSKEGKKPKLNDTSDENKQSRKNVVKKEITVVKQTNTIRNDKNKGKNSVVKDCTDISKKKHVLQNPTSSSIHTKKILKLPKTLKTIDPVHIEKNRDKREIERIHSMRSKNIKLEDKVKSKESKASHLTHDNKNSKSSILVEKTTVSKDIKENGSKKKIWKSAPGASRSFGRSVEVKLKRPNVITKDTSKAGKTISNKILISDIKCDRKDRSERETKERLSKALHMNKKLLKKLERSMSKSNVDPKSNLEKEVTVDFTQDNLQQEFLCKERFFLTNSIFKTVSKKSDKLPSQNMGTESYKKLWKWSHYVRMPSSMWSLHKHPKGDYVIILHISEISSLPKIIIDKYVQFKENSIPIVKLYDIEVPSLQTTAELRTLGEVCSYLKQIDNLSLCASLKSPSWQESNSNCEMFTRSKVSLPFTCKYCSKVGVQGK